MKQILDKTNIGNEDMANLTPEGVRHFLIGLQQHIRDDPEMTQKKFCEGGVTTEVNLSRLFTKLSGASPEMIEALADEAGVAVGDLVLKGKILVNGHPPTDTTREPQSVIDWITSAAAAISREHSRVLRDNLIWEAVINSSNNGVLLFDVDKTCVYDNETARGIYGGTLRGQVISCVCKGASDTANRCPDCPLAKTYATQTASDKHVYISGHPYQVSTFHIEVEGEQRTLAILRDNAELDRAKIEHDYILEIFDAAMNITSDIGIVFANKDRRVVIVNDAFLRITKTERHHYVSVGDIRTKIAEIGDNPRDILRAAADAREKMEMTSVNMGVIEGKQYAAKFKPVFSRGGDFLGVLTRLMPVDILHD